jgi:hypothetical protein
MNKNKNVYWPQDGLLEQPAPRLPSSSLQRLNRPARPLPVPARRPPLVPQPPAQRARPRPRPTQGGPRQGDAGGRLHTLLHHAQGDVPVPSVISNSILYIQFHPLYPIPSVISNSIRYIQFHPLYLIPSVISNSICYIQFHPLYPIPSVISKSIRCIQFHPLYPIPSVISNSIRYTISCSSPIAAHLSC